MNYFTRNRVLTLVLMLLVTINLAALTMIGINTGIFGEAKADSRKPREERRHREKTGRMMESRLELNDEQKVKLDATRKEHMNQMRALSTEMDEARNRMEQELNETIIDLAKVQQLNQKIAEIDVSLRQEIIDLNVQTREILSEEQLLKYIDMRKDMSRKWRGEDGGSNFSKRRKKLNSK